MKTYFLVGTYSEAILFGTGELFTGKGEGVYLCSFDEGEITVISCLKLGNPSFLAVDEQRRHIYAVNEMKEFRGEYGGGLTDIQYDERGKMTVLDSFPTGGGDPCHVAISPDRCYVAVANFADGRVTIFPLSEDGTVLPDKKVFEHHGSGMHPIRQRGPHAHSILFDGGGSMFVPDLGIDKLKAYRVTSNGIVPDDDRSVNLTPGSGPRSGDWSRDKRHFYLINELESSITHMRYNEYRMEKIETISTLPEGVVGDNICADLHLTSDGKYLYASNRGNDSIAMFQVVEDGSLTNWGWVPSGGRTPRNFAIDPSGRHIVVANQNSDCMAIFAIEPDGKLTLAAKKDFPTPVCIKFLTESSFTC